MHFSPWKSKHTRTAQNLENSLSKIRSTCVVQILYSRIWIQLEFFFTILISLIVLTFDISKNIANNIAQKYSRWNIVKENTVVNCNTKPRPMLLNGLWSGICAIINKQILQQICHHDVSAENVLNWSNKKTAFICFSLRIIFIYEYKHVFMWKIPN